MMARPTDVRDARDLARAMAEDKRRAGSVPPTGASRPVDESTSAGRKAEQAEKAGPAPKTRRQRRSLWFVPSAVNAKLIYAGYLASLAIPFTALISAFFAYQSAKQSPPEWLESHYIYQMRTFWIGLVANVIAWALSFAGVGLLLFPLIAVWVVARSVKGLIRVAHEHPIEEPNSYFV